MIYYLIVCRSLTQAQKIDRVLERSGITGHIMRSPTAVSANGCSHSVKIAQRNLTKALTVLKRIGLTNLQVYLTEGDGTYREVQL